MGNRDQRVISLLNRLGFERQRIFLVGPGESNVTVAVGWIPGIGARVICVEDGTLYQELMDYLIETQSRCFSSFKALHDAARRENWTGWDADELRIRAMLQRRDGSPYDDGVAAAKRDIDANRLRLFSSAPAKTSWAADMAETLQARFGVSVEFVSDMTTADKRLFEAGYNSAVERHVDAVFGAGSFAAAHAEIQQRRAERYQHHFNGGDRPAQS
jgi:hypothetical protein